MTRYLPCLIIALLLTACGSEPVSRSQEPLPQPVVRDFSGSWEMDYGRSDNVDQKLNSMYREWQRLMARQSRGDERAAARMAAMGTNFRRLVDTARLADMITSSQVLEIEQTPDDIEITREDNFALSCVFLEGEPELVIDELGLEICGWDAHQLVFRIQLPDGLDIQHRMSMSEDSQRLHIATRVNSRYASPFTINRFYFRFDPLPENYECEYTLSRGNVCQTGNGAP